MTERIFLFPGQGSQVVGMGKDLYEKSELGKKLFAAADDILGYRLSEICFEGPEEELTLTHNTQPALLTVSTILYRLLGAEPLQAAGHSLGEYSALVAAGAMRFEDAVLLVHRRGKYMQEAVPVGQGAMAAVMGMNIDRIRQVISQVEGPVDIANWNSDSQIVISGKKESVERAARQLSGARVVFLPVSAPFHSRLMAPAEERLGVDLDGIDFEDPRFPVVANVTAEPNTSGAQARELLKRQVSRPVLWHSTMLHFLNTRQARRFVEIGTGRVLSGLLRRTARDTGIEVETETIQTMEDI